MFLFLDIVNGTLGQRTRYLWVLRILTEAEGEFGTGGITVHGDLMNHHVSMEDVLKETPQNCVLFLILLNKELLIFLKLLNYITIITLISLNYLIKIQCRLFSK